MSMVGQVVSIERVQAGATLANPAAVGDTILTVDSTLDLAPEGGTLALSTGEVVTYLPVDTYGSALLLSDALPVALEDGERLLVDPPEIRTRALVLLDGDVDLEPLPIDVPATVAGWATLEDGAALRFEDVDGRLVATDVVGDEPGGIVEGDPYGERVEIRRGGFRMFVIGPNGMPYPLIELVNGRVSVRVMGQDGTILSGLGSDGSVTGRVGSFSQGMTIGGVDLMGQVGGGVAPGVLDRFPRGLVRPRARRTTSKTAGGGSENIFIRQPVPLFPGRQYRAVGSLNATVGDATDAIRTRLRVTTDNSATTISSRLLAQTTQPSSGTTNHGKDAWVEGFFNVLVPGTVQVALFGYGLSSTSTLNSGYLYVEDIGPIDFETPETVGDDGGMTVYTTTWRATDTRMYDKNGNANPGSDGKIDLWYWHGSPTNYNNAAVLFGGTAIESTDSLELGKTMGAALTGATLISSTITVRNKVWYGADNDTGVTTLNTLSGTSLPSTKAIDGTRFVGGIRSGEITQAATPTAWWTNGSNLGFTIGDKDAKTLNGSGQITPLTSGAFHGINDTDPPLITHIYSRPSA